MLQGIDINETIEYISESDTDKTNPTKFILGNISNKDKLKIFSSVYTEEEKVDISKLQDRSLDILKAGLKEIRNLGGQDTKDITDEVIDRLPIGVVVELVAKILEINFIGSVEKKI